MEGRFYKKLKAFVAIFFIFINAIADNNWGKENLAWKRKVKA